MSVKVVAFAYLRVAVWVAASVVVFGGGSGVVDIAVSFMCLPADASLGGMGVDLLVGSVSLQTIGARC